jgi:hypothetical protein
MIPVHAKQITQITFDKLKYLTKTYADTITPCDFDIETGRPLNNIRTTNTINYFLLSSINSSLSEGKHICDFICHEGVEGMHDIEITDETSLSALFANEGASMQNMFGYYMYIKNEDGSKILLDTECNNDGVYYSPTIIFPHVKSEQYKYLQSSDTRLLKGNMPDGKFKNICVGFFLVPHGWYAFTEKSTIDNDSILHSTTDFNAYSMSSLKEADVEPIVPVEHVDECVEHVVEECGEHIVEECGEHVVEVCVEHEMEPENEELVIDPIEGEQLTEQVTESMIDQHDIINKKIYSVFTKIESSIHKNNNLLMIGFEDMIHEKYEHNDMDYNDCVVCIEISNINNIVNYDKYTVVNFGMDPPIYVPQNSLIYYDEYGEYVSFDKRKYNIIDADYILERYIYCNNKTLTSYYYDALLKININYVINITKTCCSDIFAIKIEYCLRQHDIINATNNDIVKLYLMESKHTEFSEEYGNSLIINYKNMFNNLIHDKSYYEKYDFSIKIVSIHDIIESPVNATINHFRIFGNGVIDCMNKTAYIPSDITNIYQLYKNVNNCTKKGIVINICMDTHPHTYMMGVTTFIKYITFIVDSTYNMTIDMHTLSIYKYDGCTLVLQTEFNAYPDMHISDIYNEPNNNDQLSDIYKYDKDATYRVITLCNSMVLYCINLSTNTVLSSIILVYIDNMYYWGNTRNEQSGIYYSNQISHIIESHTQI